MKQKILKGLFVIAALAGISTAVYATQQMKTDQVQAAAAEYGTAPTYELNDTIYIGGQPYIVTSNYFAGWKLMTSDIIATSTYENAASVVSQRADSIPAKEKSALGLAARVPTKNDLNNTGGATGNNAKNIAAPWNIGKDYWTAEKNNDNTASFMGANGYYNATVEFLQTCSDSKTNLYKYSGKVISPIALPAKTNEDISVPWTLYPFIGGVKTPQYYFGGATPNCPTYINNWGYDSTAVLQAYYSEETAPAQITNGCYFNGANASGGTRSFKPQGTRNRDTARDLEYVGVTVAGGTCPAVTIPASNSAGVRPLLQINNNIYMATASKYNGGALASGGNTGGSHLILKDGNLKAAIGTVPNDSDDGYTLSGTTLKVTDLAVDGNTVKIPVNFSGSTYSSEKTDQKIAVEVTNLNGTTVFGTIGSLNENGKGDGILDISNLIPKVDGKYSGSVALKIYQLETTSGNYSNYISSSPLSMTLSIVAPEHQQIEWQADQKVDVILDSNIDIVAHMQAATTDWSPNAGYSISAKSGDESKITIGGASMEDYPIGGTGNNKIGNGKVTYNITAKADSGTATVVLKKLAPANSKSYVDSDEIELALNLYAKISDAEITSEFTDHKTVYGSVESGTKVASVTDITGGIPDNYTYEIDTAGGDKDKFAIDAAGVITATQLLDAGTYSIPLKISDSAGNFINVTSPLEITKRPISITASQTDFMYTATPDPYTWDITTGTLVSSDVDHLGSISISYKDKDSNPITDNDITKAKPGDYSINFASFSKDDAGNERYLNYEITNTPSTFTIAKATSAAPVSSNISLEYGDTTLADGSTAQISASGGNCGSDGNGTCSYEFSIKSGDSIAITDKDTGTFTTSKVGDTVVTVKKVTDDYYLESETDITVTVTPRNITVKAKDQSRKVGEANPNNELELTASSKALVSGDKLADFGGNFEYYEENTFGSTNVVATVDASTPIGTYDIGVSGPAKDNYNVTVSTTEVGKLEIEVAVPDKPIIYNFSMEYGDTGYTYKDKDSAEHTVPTNTLKPSGGSCGVDGKQTCTYKYSVQSGDSVTLDDDATGNFTIHKTGDTVVRITKQADSYYGESYEDVTITIQARTIHVKAVDQEKTVNDEIPVNSITLANGSKTLVGNDKITDFTVSDYAYYEKDTFKTDTPVAVDMKKTTKSGTYDIAPTSVTKDYYNVQMSKSDVGVLTVNRADSSEPFLNNFSVVYGDDSYQYTDQSGAEQTSASLIMHGEKGNCGEDGNGVCGYSYAVKDPTGDDAITITAADTGAFTINHTGTVTVIVTKLQDDWYNASSKETTVTITPRAITIKPKRDDFTYKQTVTTLDYDVTKGNILASDSANMGTLNVTYQDSAGREVSDLTTAKPGTYDITYASFSDAAGKTRHKNYTITGEKGSFTIEKAESEAPVMNSFSLEYGDTSYQYTETTDSGNVDKSSSDLTLHAIRGNCGADGNSTCSYTYTVDTPADSDAITILDADKNTGAFTINKTGSVTVIITKLEDDYYKAKTGSVTVTVTPRKITVKAKNQSKAVGEELPVNELELASDSKALAAGDAITDFAASFGYFESGTFASSPVAAAVTKDTAVGTYDIAPTSVTKDNYEISVSKSEVGVLTITQESDLSKYYDITKLPDSGWYAEDVVLTPKHADYNQMLIIYDGNTICDFSKTAFTLDKQTYEGAHTFTLQFKNETTGAVTAQGDITISIDVSKPVIESLDWSEVTTMFASLRAAIDSNYTKPAMLSVSATDENGSLAVSGIDTYSFNATAIDVDGKDKADGGSSSLDQSSNTFTLSANNRYKVKVVVKDKAGNSTEGETFVTVDDKTPAAPTMKIKKQDDTKEWDQKFSDKNLVVNLKEAVTSKDGKELYSDFDRFQLKKASDTVFSDISVDADGNYIISDAEVDELYTFQAVYKNGSVSESSEQVIKIDQTPPEFKVTSVIDMNTDTAFVNGEVSEKGLKFTLTPDKDYLSETSWYVMKKEDGKEGTWEAITPASDQTWSTEEDFKGEWQFKAVNEAGVESTVVVGASGEISHYVESDVKLTQISNGTDYTGSWTNQTIVISAEGGFKIADNIKGYEYTTDDPVTADSNWTYIGKEQLVIEGVQEINKTYTFRALPVDETRKPSSKTAQAVIHYDSVAPVISLVKSTSKPIMGSVTLSVTAMQGKEASPLASYSFDSGMTWTPAPVSGTITKEFTENANAVFKLKDEAGNVTEEAFVIDNIVTEGPKEPIIEKADEYTEKDWTNQSELVKVQAPSATDKVYYQIDGIGEFKLAPAGGIPVTENGTHTIVLYTESEVGLQSGDVTIKVNIDKIIPTDITFEFKENQVLSLLSNLTNGYLGKENVKVSIAAQDTLSGVAGYEYQIVKKNANPTESGWKSGSTTYVEGDFDGYVYTRVKDRAGNMAVAYTVDGVKVDKTGPVISAGQDMNEFQALSKLQVSVSDAISGVDQTLEYQMKGSSYTAVMVNNSTNIPLEEGAYDLKLIAKDILGNTTEKTVALKIDNQDPSISVTNQLAADKTKATFNIQVTTGESKLKEISVTAAKGGKVMIPVTKDPVYENGSYKYSISYEVQANDTYSFEVVTNAGKKASTKQTITGITYKKPVLGIDGSYVSGTWSAQAVEFGVKSVNGITAKTIEYRTGSDRWQTYTGKIKEAHEGTTVYEFIADRGTDTESTILKMIVNVDTTAPEVPVIQNSALYGTDLWHNQTMKVSAEKKPSLGCEEHIEVSMDKRNFVSKDSMELSSEGSYRVYFKTVDALGRSSASVEAIVNIDKSAPTNLSITTNTNQFKSFLNTITFKTFFKEKVDVHIDADYSISGKGDTYYYLADNAMTQAQLDALSESSWTKGDSFSIQEEFKGIIYAKTSDAAGNMTPVVSSDGLEVSFQAPTLNVKSDGKEEWTDKESISIECPQSALDADYITDSSYTIQTATPKKEYITLKGTANITDDQLPEGEYDVLIEATNKFGLTSTKTIHVKKDAKTPEISVIGDIQDVQEYVDFVIEVKAGISGIAQLKAVDVQGNTEVIPVDENGKAVYRALYNSTYEFIVTSKAGKSASKTAVITSIDNVNPSIVVAAESNGSVYLEHTWTKNPVTLTLSDGGNLSGITYQYKEKGSTQDFVELGGNTLQLQSLGTHTYILQATRTVDGFDKTSTKEFTVKFDDQLPYDPILDTTGYSSSDWHQSGVTLHPTLSKDADRADSWLEYSFDGGINWIKGSTIAMDQDGSYTVTVRSMNELNQASAAAVTANVNIDAKAPNDVNIQIKDNAFKTFLHNISFSLFFKENQDVTLSASDANGVDHYEYQIVEENGSYQPDGPWITSDGTFSLSKGFKGVVYARAVDIAGNTSAAISSNGIIIDANSPFIEVRHTMQEYTPVNYADVAVSDLLSGTESATYEVYTNGVLNYRSSIALSNDAGKIQNLPDGEHMIKVSAVDRAGNLNTTTTNVKIDTKRPVVKLNGVDAGNEEYLDINVDISNVGPSGIQSVMLSGDKIHQQLLEPNADGTYQYKALINGTYTVTVTNNAGLSASDTIIVRNIKTQKPVVKVTATTEGKTYVEGTWAKDVIELTASNVNENLKNVKLYYSEDGSDYQDYSGVLRIVNDDHDAYYFKAVAEDGTESEVVIFHVKSDMVGPKQVQLKTPEAFTDDVWHTAQQLVEIEFTPAATGSKEWSEYKIDDGEWAKLSASRQSVSYDMEGKHIITFRSADELNRVSDEVIAYVNIDHATTANGQVSIDAQQKLQGDDLSVQPISLILGYGVSGIKEVRVSGDMIRSTVLSPNADQSYSYDATANGTYTFSITTVSGETATTTITIGSVVSKEPQLKTSILNSDGDEYLVEEGWSDKVLNITVSDKNTQTDASSTKTLYLKNAAGNYVDTGSSTALVNTTGIREYKAVVEYMDDEGKTHTKEDIFTVKVDLDPVKQNTLVIDQDDKLGSDAWLGIESRPDELTASFDQQLNGCEEWTEYSFDGGKTWSRGAADITGKPDGTYQITYRVNDELGTGNSAAGISRTVNIDMSAPKRFHMYFTEPSSFLRSIFFKNAQQVNFDGSFEIAGFDHIEYKVVNEGETFDPSSSTANWDTLNDLSDSFMLNHEFKGKIYARAFDKAGNRSDLLESDKLIVDVLAPAIALNGNAIEDAANPDLWGSKNNIQVVLTSSFSGLVDGSGTYSLTNLDDGNVIEGVLKFSTQTGTSQSAASITNIPNGKYTLQVDVTSNAGRTTTETRTIKVDNVAAKLAVAGHDSSGTLARKETLILTPTVGISEVKSMELISALDIYGNPVDGITQPFTIEKNAEGVYEYEVNDNAVYSFKVTSNNGTTAVKTLDIQNINNVDPTIALKATSYSPDMTPNEITTNTWTANRIDFALSLTNADAYKGTVTWQYKLEDGPWTNIRDTNGKASSRMSVSSDGVYHYQFRAMGSMGYPSEAVDFIVKIDKTGPAKPVFTTNTFGTDDWHTAPVDVKVNFKAAAGCSEWSEYRLLKKYANGKFAPILVDGEEWHKENHYYVDTEGTTYIEFRGRDEMGRISDTVLATVNISLRDPNNFTITYGENVVSKFLNLITFNTFFKDYVDVKFAAVDPMDSTGKSLHYEYILVSKEEHDSGNFDPESPDNIWTSLVGNTLKLDPNWEGLIYGKAVAASGRTSQIIRTDGITLDNIEPTIKITPSSMSSWSQENALHIEAKDVADSSSGVASGMKKITWSNNLSGVHSAVDEELILDDGAADLIDLADGNYMVTIKAFDNANNVKTNTVNVMFDRQRPSISIEGHSEDPITDETLTLKPSVGASGLKSLEVYQDGRLLSNAIDIVYVNGKQEYQYHVTENGTYEFVVTNGAGISASTGITITNISNQAPRLSIQAKIGSANYVENAWTSDVVELTISNTIANLYDVDLYYIEEKDGTITAPKADAVTISDDQGRVWIKFNGNLSLEEQGVYYYQFKGISASGMESSIETYRVRIDRTKPETPVITDVSKYGEDKWFSTNQSVTATYTDNNSGVAKHLEYNLDEARDGNGNLIWRSGSSVNVSENGIHKVSFRVKDAFGRVSESASANVNIDKQVPDFKATVVPQQGNALISFSTNLGVSGISSFTIKKQGDTGIGRTIIDNQVTVTDKGIYEVTLTSKAGLSFTSTVEVQSLNMENPKLTIQLSDGSANGKDTYDDAKGTWRKSGSRWADHAIKITATLDNEEEVGNVTYYINIDSKGFIAYSDIDKLEQVIGEEADYAKAVEVEIKAISDSGQESEVYTRMICIDKEAPDDTYAVHDTVELTDGSLIYKEDEWQSSSQSISTTFQKHVSGSEEFLEYKVVRTDVSPNVKVADWVKQMTYDISESGIYEVSVRTNDELGRSGAERTFEVKLDKELPQNLTASIGENSFTTFLNKLTLGYFFKDPIEIKMSADFGVSQSGTIYYQIVEKEADYHVNNTWSTYDGVIKKNSDFHGIVYFYAVSASGNRTGILRTDGVTVDTINPSISVSVPRAGYWTNDSSVEITAQDSNAIADVAATKGIKQISYTTTSDPVQSGNINVDAQGKAKLNLADGAYDISATALDYADRSSSTTQSVRIDTQVPVLAVSGHNADLQVQQEVLSFSMSYGVSGLQEMDESANTAEGTGRVIKVIQEVTDENGKKVTTRTALHEQDTFTVTQNGRYSFIITNKANVQSVQQFDITNISNMKPTLDITMTHQVDGAEMPYENASWSGGPVNVQVNTQVYGAKLQYKENAGASWKEIKNQIFTLSQDGIYQVQMRAISQSGMESEIITRTVKIDTLEPKRPTVTDAQDYEEENWYSQSRLVKASFEKDLNGADEWLQYQVDEGEWINGDRVNITMPGIHEVSFRTMDELGRTSDTVMVKVKLDTTAPTNLKVEVSDNFVMSVLNSLSGGLFFNKTQDVIASADFSISGPGYFEYQIVKENEVYEPNNSVKWQKVNVTSTDMKQTMQITNLDAGFKGDVYVRAVDKVGNISQAVSTGMVTIDEEGPVITLPKVDATTWTSSNTLDFSIVDTLSGIRSATYTYTVNGVKKQGNVNLSEDGSASVTGLDNGAYKLYIEAVDNAGNTSKKSIDLHIDTQHAMIDSIIKTPEIDKTEKVDVAIKLDYSGDSGIKSVQVSGANIMTSDITSTYDDTDDSYHYTVISNGKYEVRIETNAGLVTTREFFVENIISKSPVVKLNAVYTQNDKKGLTYLSGDWATGNVEVTLQNIIDGLIVKDFYYVVYDPDDMTTPVQTARKITASNGVYKVLLDEEGSRTYVFYAINDSGVKSDNVELQVNIDRSAPNQPVIEKRVEKFSKTKWYNNIAGVDVKALIENTSGAPEWLEYNLDNDVTTEHEENWVKADDSGIVNVEGEGEHTIRFRTKDKTGRVSSISETAYVNIDSSAPSDFYIKVEDSEFRSLLNTLTFGAFFQDDAKVSIEGKFDISGIERIEYQLVNKGDTFNESDPWTTYKHSFYLNADDSLSIYARGYDKAGNTTGIIHSDLITIENVKPVITYPDYPGRNDTNGWIRDNFLRVNVTDTGSGVANVSYVSHDGLEQSISGTLNLDADGNATIYNLPDGKYYLSITASDRAGNETHSDFSIAIDREPIAFEVSGDFDTVQRSVLMQVKKEDIYVGASKVKSLEVAFTDMAGNDIVESIYPDENGNYNYYANENTSYTFTMKNQAGASANRTVNIGNIGIVETKISIQGAKEQEWIKQSDITFDASVLPVSNHLRYKLVSDEEFTEVNSYHASITANGSGKHQYIFESYDPNSVDKAAIETRTYEVWLDGDTPNAPVLMGKFGEDDYYGEGQLVSVQNRNINVASEETIQYHIHKDGEIHADGSFIWHEGDSVLIDEIGTTQVDFRIVDEVGHESELTTAIVNIANAAALDISVGGNLVDPAINVLTTISITPSGAPIESISIQDLGDPTQDPVQLKVLEGVLRYRHIITRNGEYAFTVKDKAGNVRTQTLQITNIEEEQSRLNVTLKKETSNTSHKMEQWSNEPLILTAVKLGGLEDDGAEITYTINDESIVHVYQHPILVDQTGNDIYHFHLTRNGTNISSMDVSAKVDLDIPNKPIVTDQSKFGQDIWTNDNVVRVSAVLDTSTVNKGSVERIKYKLDSDSNYINGSSVLVQADGKHTVTFVTYDEAGNESAKEVVYVNIDKQAPYNLTLSSTQNRFNDFLQNLPLIGKYFPSVERVTIEAEDSHCTPDIFYKIVPNGANPDAIDWEPYTAPFEIADAGFNGKIYAKAVDKAGNESAVIKTKNFILDDSIPVINLPNDMTDYDYQNSVAVQVASGASGIDPDSLKWRIETKDGLEVARGTYEVNAVGKGVIDNLPDGEYILYVNASSNAGTPAAEAGMRIMMEAAPMRVSARQTSVSVDHKYVEIKVNAYSGEHLRADKLYVKEGKVGVFKEIETFDEADASVLYRVTENGTYTFKAVNSATGKYAISDPLMITDIQSEAGMIDLGQYVKFVLPNSKCDVAQAEIGTTHCYFNEYADDTFEPVSIELYNQENFYQEMPSDAQLMMSHNGSAYESISLDNALIVFMDPNDPTTKLGFHTYQFKVVQNGKDLSAVVTRRFRILRYDATIVTQGNQPQAFALKAMEPFTVQTEAAFQVAAQGAQPQEDNWKYGSEELTLKAGSYTLYRKNADGVVTTKELEVSNSLDQAVIEVNENKWKSFLDMITLHLFDIDTFDVEIQMSEEYASAHQIEYKMNDEWLPYEGVIHVNASVKEIQIKATELSSGKESLDTIQIKD